MREFFARFLSLPFDDKAAEKYGEIRSVLECVGRPIGPADLCIAAIALANKIILVTHNCREFQRIEKLRVEDWGGQKESEAKDVKASRSYLRL